MVRNQNQRNPTYEGNHYENGRADNRNRQNQPQKKLNNNHDAFDKDNRVSSSKSYGHAQHAEKNQVNNYEGSKARKGTKKANNKNSKGRFNRKRRTYYYNKLKVDKNTDSEFGIEQRYRDYVENDILKPHIDMIDPEIDTIEILLVAEKPQVAKRIAIALSHYFHNRYKFNKRYHGFALRGEYRGYKANFFITGLQGHILARDFPKELQNWKSVDPPIKLFDKETYKYGVERNNHIVNRLQDLARGTDIVLFWLDNDVEGENICFQVLDIISNKINPTGFRQFYRVRFSSLEYKDIQDAFLQKDKQLSVDLALRAEAKHIFDLKVGVAFTRMLTNRLKRELDVNSNKVVSFGPCQNPTFALVFKNFEKNNAVPPRTWYRVTVALEIKGNVSKNFTAFYDNNGQFKNKDEAEKFIEKLTSQTRNSNGFKVINSEIVTKKNDKLEGLNTLSLLKHASAELNINSDKTLRIAQRLYEEGFISYPRTESTHYPESMDYRSILKDICKYGDEKIQKKCKKVVQKSDCIPAEGKDYGDHTPIVPTLVVKDRLKGDEKRLYEYIINHFVASFSSQIEIKQQKCKILINGHEFIYEAHEVINSDIYDILDIFYDKESKVINELKVGTMTVVKSLKAEQAQEERTHFTESDLLESMSKNKIGTDSSMAEHISKIIQREYVSVVEYERKFNKNDPTQNKIIRALEPTQIGTKLFEFYKKHCESLVSVLLRAKIESSINKIGSKSDQQSYSEFLDEWLDKYSKRYLKLAKNIGEFVRDVKEFEETRILEKQDNSKCSSCDICKSALVVSNKNWTLSCPDCKTVNIRLKPNSFINQLKTTCQKHNCRLIEYSPPPNNNFNNNATSGNQKSIRFYFKACPNCHKDDSAYQLGQTTLKCTCNVPMCLATSKNKSGVYVACPTSNCGRNKMYDKEACDWSVVDSKHCEDCNNNVYKIDRSDKKAAISSVERCIQCEVA